MLDDNNNNSQSAILKRHTIDEEVRLAYTTPSYISYTLKNMQKLRYLFLLSICLKKNSLKLAYLILAREKMLEEILDRIEKIELRQKEKMICHPRELICHPREGGDPFLNLSRTIFCETTTMVPGHFYQKAVKIPG